MLVILIGVLGWLLFNAYVIAMLRQPTTKGSKRLYQELSALSYLIAILLLALLLPLQDYQDQAWYLPVICFLLVGHPVQLFMMVLTMFKTSDKKQSA